MQSVPIATEMSSNPADSKVFSIQRCVIKFYPRLATGEWFSLSTLVSSTNKTDHHDRTEILLKVELNTITNKPLFVSKFKFLEYGQGKIKILRLLEYLGD